MKKVLFILIMLTAITVTQGQTRKVQLLIDETKGEWNTDENRNLSYQKVTEISGVSKEELFLRAENYFTYSYNTGKDVVLAKDKDQGLIIGKGIWTDFYVAKMSSMNYSASHVLRLDIKDGKVRVTLTVQNYDILYRNRDTGSTTSVLLNSVYPLNTASATKTREGKAFYALHDKCMMAISLLILNLKTEGFSIAKGNNW